LSTVVCSLPLSLSLSSVSPSVSSPSLLLSFLGIRAPLLCSLASALVFLFSLLSLCLLSYPWSLDNFQLKVVSFFLFHFFFFLSGFGFHKNQGPPESAGEEREKEGGRGARGRVFLLLNEPRNDGRIGIFLEGFGELEFCVGLLEDLWKWYGFEVCRS